MENNKTSVEYFLDLKQQAINAGDKRVFIKKEIGKCFFVMSSGEIVDVPLEMEAKVLNFFLHAT